MEVNATTRPINSSKFDITVYIIIQLIIMEYYETLTIQITLGYRFNFGCISILFCLMVCCGAYRKSKVAAVQ